MSEKEKKKIRELLNKIKAVGKGFDDEAIMMLGCIAFSKQSDEYGGSVYIMNEMIKLLDKYPNADDFMTEAFEIVEN